jgi:ubiquitin-protein ligase
VAHAEDTLGQTGVITGLRIELQLRVSESGEGDAADDDAAVTVLRHVRASRVRHVRALHAGDHVLRGAWLGRVEECCDTLVLRLDEGAGGGVVRVEHCTRERVAPRSRATLFHDEEDCPYYPGQRVRAAAGSVLRAGRWLTGGWRGRLDATVLSVEPGEARVRWLAAIGGAAVLAPAPPEEIQKTVALQRLHAFDDSTWQIGDRALLSRRELNALRAGGDASAEAEAQGGAGGGGGEEDDEMEEAEEEGGSARGTGARRRGSRRRSRRGAASSRRGRDADAATDAATDASAAAATASTAATAPPSDVVALVTRTATFVDVLWQDATRSVDVPAATLVPITHLVDGDFWPDEFVLQKRDDLLDAPVNPSDADAGAAQQRLGLLVSVEPRQRTARVRWLGRDADGRAVLPEASQAQAGIAEVVSTFDLEPAVEYAFRQGDVVLILDAPTDDAAAQPPPAWWVGEVLAMASGRLRVAWADGRISDVAPEDVYAITRDEEDDGGEDGEDDDGFGFADADGEGYWDDAAGAWVGGEGGGEDEGSSGWETDDGAEGGEEDAEEEDEDEDEEGDEDDDAMAEPAPPPQLPRGAAAAAAARALAAALAAAPTGLPQGWVDDASEAQWRAALAVENLLTSAGVTPAAAAAGGAVAAAAVAPDAGGAARPPLPAAARQLLARVANSFWSGSSGAAGGAGAGGAAAGAGAPAVGGIRAHLEAQRAARAATRAAAAGAPAATPAEPTPADADTPPPAPAPAPAPSPLTTTAAASSEPPALLSTFSHFDSVSDAADHYYFPDAPPGGALAPRAWARAVRREWDMLQAGLPGSIWVRVYEERMDLLRVAIAGADDTPYADHLLFFDFQFPPDYPSEPPAAHYHAHGLRPNPNLYANGKVCLSLLGTWAGKEGETWQPGRSTALQVLLSLQALVLVAQPYYNEAGWSGQAGSDEGERNSGVYNEQVCLVLLRTALAALRAPPAHFGELLRAHYAARGPALLARCEALAEGLVPPPASAAGAGASGSAAAAAPPPPPSEGFRASLRRLLPAVRAAFAALAPPDAGTGADAGAGASA